MSQPVEGLAKSGQPRILMSMHIPSWETITTAGTQVGASEESGATPLIQMCYGSPALSRSVLQRMIVKKVTHLVSLMLAVCLWADLGGLVKTGQHQSLTTIPFLRLESITTAGTRLEIQTESGASPPIQISSGSTALFQSVCQQ